MGAKIAIHELEAPVLAGLKEGKRTRGALGVLKRVFRTFMKVEKIGADVMRCPVAARTVMACGPALTSTGNDRDVLETPHIDSRLRELETHDALKGWLLHLYDSNHRTVDEPLDRACSLLLSAPKLQIDEICRRIGLYNRTYLATAYKKRLGVSPATFRQSRASSSLSAGSRDET